MARLLDHAGASLWMDTARPPRFPALDGDAQADVCVAGAGIAGLSAAYTLAGAGHDVLVLDQAGLADSQTARSSGHLCSALDAGYADVERPLGPEGAHQAARSHAAAVNAIEDLCRNESIDCGFARTTGYLVRGTDPANADRLGHEFAAAGRAGIAVMDVPAPPGVMAGFGQAVRFDGQARIDPLRYLAGLAAAVQRRGVRLHGDTRVVAIEPGDAPVVRTADGRRVDSKAVVVAVDVAREQGLGVGARQDAFRTFVVAMRVDRDAVPDVLLWDTDAPYHYVRVAHATSGSWLLVGGEDRRLGEDDAPGPRHDALEAWARERFPMAGPAGYRWSGVVVESRDGLASIGRAPHAGNVFVATGGSGNGLTHGMLAGLVLPELVAGRDSPFEALYDPGRAAMR